MIDPPALPVPQWWDVIPNAEAGIVFLVTLTFIVIYAKYSNWTKTAPGKALMLWAVSFDGLILMNTIHLATGRYPGITAVRILVYGALIFSVCYLVHSLIRILRDGESITLSTFIDTEKGYLMAEREAESGTIWYKNKRVWRTLFSAILTGAVVVPQLLAIINDAWSSDFTAVVLAQALVIQSVITRIMANDTVNVWLSYIGLGSAPKSELVP